MKIQSVTHILFNLFKRTPHHETTEQHKDDTRQIWFCHYQSIIIVKDVENFINIYFIFINQHLQFYFYLQDITDFATGPVTLGTLFLFLQLHM